MIESGRGAVIATLLLIASLFGYLVLASTPKKRSKLVTCSMKNFAKFPKQVTGPVVFELSRTITIAVTNKDKTERIDITFPKSRCK